MRAFVNFYIGNGVICPRKESGDSRNELGDKRKCDDAVEVQRAALPNPELGA